MMMKKRGLYVLAAILLLGVVGLIIWKGNPDNGGPGEPTTGNDTIRIGAILPLHGDLKEYGEYGNRGLVIARQEFMEDHPEVFVDIIIEDDLGDKTKALSAVQKLRDWDHVDMIVGSMSSGLTLAVASEMEKSKIVMMAPTSTMSDVTNAGDYIFRVCVSDAFEGPCMADYIKEHFPGRKLGLVYINNDYGEGLIQNFSERCSELGVKIYYKTGYQTDTKNFRTIINNLKRREIDLVYIVAQKEQVEFFSQCKQLNYKPQFTASTMLEDHTVVERLGSFMDGSLYTYRSYDPERQDPVVSRFVNDYKEKYGVLPEYYAASTFDATKVCLYAQYEYRKSGLSLKDYLYTIKGLPGVMGTIEFDKNGDVTQGFSIKTIVDGKFVFMD